MAYFKLDNNANRSEKASDKDRLYKYLKNMEPQAPSKRGLKDNFLMEAGFKFLKDNDIKIDYEAVKMVNNMITDIIGLPNGGGLSSLSEIAKTINGEK